MRAMGEVHRLLTEQGKQELLKSDVDRRVLDAAAAYMAAEEGEIGFVYAGWAQASLPHRQACRRRTLGNPERSGIADRPTWA